MSDKTEQKNEEKAKPNKKKYQKTASRSWIMTQKADISQEELQALLEPYTYVGQLEQGKQGGEQGYKHYQIYIENPTPIRFETLKNKLPTCHLEPRYGTKQEAYDYVTKSETKIGESFSNGTIDLSEEQGRRKDIEVIRNAILIDNKTASQVILEHEEAGKNLSYVDRLFAERMNLLYSENDRPNIEVTYVFGEPGGGKTTYCLNLFPRKDVFRVTSYKHPFDNYRYQKVLLLDEFDEQFDIEYMNNLLDRFPCELDCRYTPKWAAWEKVFIISNIELYKQYRRESELQVRAFRRRIHHVKTFKDGGFVEKKLDILEKVKEEEAEQIGF